MPETTNNLPAVNYYTPVELVGIYRNFLEKREVQWCCVAAWHLYSASKSKQPMGCILR